MFSKRDISNTGNSVEVDRNSLWSYYSKEHIDRTGGRYDFWHCGRTMNEYLVVKVTDGQTDIYIAIATSRGTTLTHYSGVSFEAVTVIVE